MGGGRWKKGKRNHGERKMRIGSRPTSTRDVPPLAAGSALGDSDNGDDQVDGDSVEFESVKKSLRVYRQIFWEETRTSAPWYQGQLPILSPRAEALGT